MKKLIISIFLLLFSLNLISQTKKSEKEAEEKRINYNLLKEAIKNDTLIKLMKFCLVDENMIKPSSIKMFKNDSTLVYFNNKDSANFEERFYFKKVFSTLEFAQNIAYKSNLGLTVLKKNNSDYYKKYYNYFNYDSSTLIINDNMNLIDDSCNIIVCNKKLKINHNGIIRAYDYYPEKIRRLLPLSFITLEIFKESRNKYVLIFEQPRSESKQMLTYKIKRGKIRLISTKYRKINLHRELKI